MRLIRFLIFGGLFVASGSHLALLQSYAWMTMAVANLRSSAPGPTLEKTFGGRNPCHVCLQVKKQVQSQGKQYLRGPEARQEWFYRPTSFAAAPPPCREFPQAGAWLYLPPETLSLVPPPKPVLA
ncbi:MAG: hypothetical protein HY611_09065 [Elusimicrobia bacterium]|nr:hypothetical protein [Elusimicrobiota bacterium]